MQLITWEANRNTERNALSKWKFWANLPHQILDSNLLLIAPVIDGIVRIDLDLRWINKNQVKT